MWIMVDPGSTSHESSKLLIKSVEMKYDIYDIEEAKMRLIFNSVFLTILQIFSPEVMLIRDQVLINVGACDF